MYDRKVWQHGYDKQERFTLVSELRSPQAYIQERGHLPDKHVVENRALLSWAKYQRKKIKEGALEDEKRELFEALLATRSNEHTGGRRMYRILILS